MKKHIFQVVAVIFLTQPVFGDDSILVQFTGIVTTIDDPAGVYSEVSISDPVTGYYRYDLTLSDSDPDPARGEYLASGTENGLWITVGTIQFSQDPINPLKVVIIDNAPVTHDSLWLTTSFEDLPGCTGTGAMLIFRDVTDAAITNDALFVDAPDLNALPLAFGIVLGTSCGPGGDDATLAFDVTSVTGELIQDIPAVSEWGMFILALTVLSCGTIVLRRRCAVSSS